MFKFVSITSPDRRIHSFRWWDTKTRPSTIGISDNHQVHSDQLSVCHDVFLEVRTLYHLACCHSMAARQAAPYGHQKCVNGKNQINRHHDVFHYTQAFLNLLKPSGLPPNELFFGKFKPLSVSNETKLIIKELEGNSIVPTNI